MSWINEIQHDISTIQSTPIDLKKFGLTIGGVFILLSIAAFAKNWWSNSIIIGTGVVGVYLCISGIFIPKTLRMIHRWWMSFAIILGSFVSRIILFVVFFSVVTIISLAAKIFGKKFYTGYDKKQSSYWIHRDPNKTINYERMS